MIPRYQRILFMILFGSSLLMLTYLIYLHRQNAQVKNADNTPLEAPSTYSASEMVTLALANDADGSVTATSQSLALPQQPAVRARALLDHLLAEYSRPHAAHAIGGGVAVDDVFLVTLPLGGQRAVTAAKTLPKDDGDDPLTHGTGELAIVNLRSAWVDAHPSGITSETLTIRSIVGTLHANLPEITRVRFLVDGKPRPTLAGNVVFDRTYDAGDAVSAAPVSGQ